MYPPEVSSAAQIIAELAEGLATRGYMVSVLATYPRHYLPAEFRQKKFAEVTEEGGVKIIRIKILAHRKVNFILRGFSQLLMPLIFFWKASKFIKDRIDTIIVFTPPLPLALAAGALKRRHRARFILLVGDIFPQNAIDLRILSGWKYKPAVWLFEWMEKAAYKSADILTFHSEAGRQYLIEKRAVPPEKVVTIPHWIDVSAYQNLTRHISFRARWAFQGKFIFLFAGVIGPAQRLEFILEVAKQVPDLKNIIFLLVGDGMERKKIEQLIKNGNINNVLVKPFVSEAEYPYLVRDADVGLVCLSPENRTPFVPGKLWGYLAAGKPVLAFLHKESGGFELIENAGCGYAIPAQDAKAAAALVRQMYHDRQNLPRLGERGLVYATKHLSLEKGLDAVEKLF
ncbi:MAG: glycosyltransferase family 4 protein [Candidatus Doudnabacteria bacterium]|nr:glycosyltransferase family 4 protein [Candidatus Doudnabacteria bacterium]